MSIRYYILLFLFFSCNQNKKKLINTQSQESVKFYLSKINDTTITDIQKLRFIDRAYQLTANNSNTKENRNIISEISLLYYNQNNLEKFKKSSFELLSKSNSSGDTLMMAKAYRYIGGYYKLLKVNDSSFYYYIKAKSIYKKFKTDDDYYYIVLNEGIVKYNINDYIGADLAFSKAYNYFKRTNNPEKLILVCIQLGLVKNESKDFEKSIEYFNEALKLILKENDDYQKSICYNNLGLVYNNLKDYKTAIVNFNLALKNKAISREDPELYGHLLDNLGYSNLNDENYKNLPNLFYQSLKIRDSIGDKPSIIVSNNHLSEYYYKIKDTTKALQFAKKSLNIANNSRDAVNIILALKQASIVDKRNASKYSEKYIYLSDSLQVVERKNKDRFARIELETDELRQQNTQLSEQNRDILNYFAIAIVFGGFLFFARFQRLKARELALKQTQQQANEEIYRLIISHQNQLEEGRDLEKKRISKELHDGVLGRLFGLRLNLDGLNNFDDEETKKQRLEYLNELKLIEQDLREISHELSRENLVLINNFVAIINNLLEQQSKINKAKINTLISDKIDWEKVSNTIKINLYRILQESLQNINKHAEASKINVIFNKDPKGNLIFSVEDNGKGYNTNGKKAKGIGMDNIVDRVHQCQGKIDIKSQIGKGTKIIITFPLENETINM